MKPEWTAPIKDPADSLRHSINAAAQFLKPGETISSYTVTAPPGLTIANPAEADGIISWTVAGGAAGATYDVVIRITTSLPRTVERTIRYLVDNR